MTDIYEENIVQNDAEHDELDTGKSIEFDVLMDSKILYDYLMYHAYSTSAGILGTSIGAMLLIIYIYKLKALFLVLGIIIILYIPVELWIRSKKLVALTPSYKKPLHYIINRDGVNVSQDEVSQTLSWDCFVKASSTKNSILLYSGKRNASVFPRKQLADKIPAIIGTITENMDPKKVKIRW